MTSSSERSFWQTVATRSILHSAAKVAFVVGAILNLINQGSAVWHGAGISWWHVLLNFAVPFCVSSYSAAKNQMERAERTDT